MGIRRPEPECHEARRPLSGSRTQYPGVLRYPGSRSLASRVRI